MKINKYNEFVNNDVLLIIKLIEESENTNSSDPEEISNKESYKNIIKLGDSAIPYIIERKKYMWNIALKEITGITPKGDNSTEIMNFWQKWYNEK